MEKIAMTLLNCYADIDYYVSSIETYITRSAVYSYNSNCISNYTTTLQQTTEILALIEKKSDLMELKQMIKKALDELTPKQMNIIRQYFFERKSKDEMLVLLGITKRTLYRRLHEVLQSFVKRLMARQFDQKWFEEKCLSQNWIKDIWSKAKLTQAL